jgi:hypothetical protein
MKKEKDTTNLEDSSLDYYVCETATAKMWQKWLNQWKHRFDMHIISMQCTDKTTTILLKRREKVDFKK